METADPLYGFDVLELLYVSKFATSFFSWSCFSFCFGDICERKEPSGCWTSYSSLSHLPVPLKHTAAIKQEKKKECRSSLFISIVFFFSFHISAFYHSLWWDMERMAGWKQRKWAMLVCKKCKKNLKLQEKCLRCFGLLGLPISKYFQRLDVWIRNNMTKIISRLSGSKIETCGKMIRSCLTLWKERCPGIGYYRLFCSSCCSIKHMCDASRVVPH